MNIQDLIQKKLNAVEVAAKDWVTIPASKLKFTKPAAVKNGPKNNMMTLIVDFSGLTTEQAAAFKKVSGGIIKGKKATYSVRGSLKMTYDGWFSSLKKKILAKVAEYNKTGSLAKPKMLPMSKLTSKLPKDKESPKFDGGKLTSAKLVELISGGAKVAELKKQGVDLDAALKLLVRRIKTLSPSSKPRKPMMKK